MNYNRRHLEKGERAISAAKYATQKAGNPNLQKNAGDSQSCQVGTIAPVTNAEAAEKFGVSARDVDRANQVLADGTPELQKAPSPAKNLGKSGRKPLITMDVAEWESRLLLYTQHPPTQG